MTDHSELLRRYAEEKSEAAFADFVQRHIGMVYGLALRKVGGDAHLAKDVAQQVFTAVAAKAGSLWRHPALNGWLFTSTHYAATQLVRAERRRQAREQKAQTMNELHSESEPTVDWEKLRPVLDDLIRELGERDREALLLRFFEGRSLADVGAKIRLTEEGARSRVDRALAKMQARLARRGVTSTGAALALMLANQVSAAAPAGLAASVTGAALAGATGGAEVAWMAFFAMNKIKAGIVVLVLLAALVPPLVELQANQTLKTELKNLQGAGVEAKAENTRLINTLTMVGGKTSAPNEAGDLVQLRARVALLRSRPDGVAESRMRPPTNAGFVTPEAAFETINWAVTAGDWATFAKSWAFEGETKKNANAFFAGLSSEAQQKFGTPERALAYGLLAVTFPRGGDWMTAMQIYDTEIVEQPASVRMRIWQRLGTGREIANETIFEQMQGGWVASRPGVAKIVNLLIPKLDPKSGEPRPK